MKPAQASNNEAWIETHLERLRRVGFKIDDSRQGVIIRWPRHTTILYGHHEVDNRTITNLLADIRNWANRALGFALRPEDMP